MHSGAWIILGCTSLVATSAQAGEQTLPAKGISHVMVGSASGDIEVVGWDKEEIRVVSEKLRVSGKGDELHIGARMAHSKVHQRAADDGHDRDARAADDEQQTKARAADHDHQADSRWLSAGWARAYGQADIRIWLPRRLSVAAQTLSGDVTIEKLGARASALTVSGDVRTEGCSGATEIETVSGDVEVSRHAADLRLKSVSGDLRAKEVVATLVEVKVVSGDITLERIDVRTVRANSQSGDVLFAGKLRQDGNLDIQAFSGEIELRLPSSFDFELDAKSHSGRVMIKRQVTFSERFNSQVRARSGQMGPKLRINSFSGDIIVR